MKQLIATSLLIGYLTLVPFCLFGGALFMKHLNAVEMSADPMHLMHDCKISIAGCSHTMDTGAMDTVIHHVSMYLSITQTPILTLFMIVVILTLLSLVVFKLSHHCIRAIFLIIFRVYVREMRWSHITIKQKILSWLSLFETSPNFA